MLRLGMSFVGVGLAAALSACGGGGEGGGDFTDRSAADIVSGAKSVMGDLEAVKVTGSVTTGGQQIDLEVQANSEGDCTGSFGSEGGKAELLGVGGQLWFRPDEAFWRASAGASADQLMRLVGDKWVVVPAEDDSFGEFCDIDKLLDQLLSDQGNDKPTYTKGETSQVGGEDVIAIKSESKSEGASTGYVRVDDPHYLTKLEKTQGEDTGDITFSEFDKDFDVQAPADDEVVDLDKLGS